MSGSPYVDGVTRVSMRRRLSFWLSVLIIAVLVSRLLWSLEQEAERAERASVRQVLNQVRATLVIKTATLQLPRQEPMATVWAGANPMNWMQGAPGNYSGICVSPSALASGHWCYQRFYGDGGVLVYRSRDIGTIEGQAADREGLFRWRVRLNFEDRNGNGRFDRGDRLIGLELVRWWPAPENGKGQG
ncbi:hypothetical protein [Mangrovitalea sediminis]|uniref:hypothetical protein n=1 Tax=Mangrovitalea sediminis TaxID=1982043 RepID=UPI000BE5BC32|nr:hypothetical protein [Mangrovitalea sediminis]